jgi:hypothetical protein
MKNYPIELGATSPFSPLFVSAINWRKAIKKVEKEAFVTNCWFPRRNIEKEIHFEWKTIESVFIVFNRMTSIHNRDLEIVLSKITQ